MISRVSRVRTLVRAGLVTAALVVTSVVPLSASAQALTASRFSLVIDGMELGSFAEAAGITTEGEPLDLTAPTSLNRLPGRPKSGEITLTRGLSSSLSLWRWASLPPGGDAVARKSATLIRYNDFGRPVARFYLENAWPAKIVVQPANGSKNEVSIETVELVADSIQVMQ